MGKRWRFREHDTMMLRMMMADQKEKDSIEYSQYHVVIVKMVISLYI